MNKRIPQLLGYGDDTEGEAIKYTRIHQQGRLNKIGDSISFGHKIAAYLV